METVSILINFRSKRNRRVEVEMTQSQLKDLIIKLESNAKFLEVFSGLYINKSEILSIEVVS